MAECLRQAQPVSVANHVKAHQSLIERAVTWLATESGWARSKRSTICSGKLCGGFIIFEHCCSCEFGYYSWWYCPHVCTLRYSANRVSANTEQYVAILATAVQFRVALTSAKYGRFSPQQLRSMVIFSNTQWADAQAHTNRIKILPQSKITEEPKVLKTLPYVTNLC